MNSLQNNTPDDNPEHYCRLCFSTKNLVRLFPEEGEPRGNLVDQILRCTGIEISQNLESFSSICWRCAVTLEDYQEFRKRSLEHDSIVRKLTEEKSCKLSDLSENTLKLAKEVENLIKSEPEYVLDIEESELMETERDSEELMISVKASDVKEFIDNDAAYEHDFTCNVCEKILSTKRSLQFHMREQHSNLVDRPHKCSHCPSTFKRKGHLKDHMAAHTGEQKFTCEECGSEFYKPGSLRRHRRRVHQWKAYDSTGKTNLENVFECDYCPKKFKQQSSLSLHAQSHYEKLPYVCELCHLRFENELDLTGHKTRLHKRQMTIKYKATRKNKTKCPYCPRLFSDCRYMATHIRYLHPDESLLVNSAVSEAT